MITYSVIIPTCLSSGDKFLKPCVESIIKFSPLSEMEIIIIANGCPNETRDYLQTLPINYFRFFWFDALLGYVKAVNEGIEKANGEYIILLNNDVLLLNYTWIWTLLEPFTKNNDVGITGPGKWWFYAGANKFAFIAFWCAMFKKELVEEIGLLDETFNPGCGEDIDFCIKAALAGKQIVGVPENPNTETDIVDIHLTKFPIFHAGGGTFSLDHQGTLRLIDRSHKILADRYQ